MSLLRVSQRTIARAARPQVQIRDLHVENTVNNNFPFKYHKKKPFVAKLLAFTGVSFGVPFAAVEFKKRAQ